MNVRENTDKGESPFIGLRKALEPLPIFTLFLSTDPGLFVIPPMAEGLDPAGKLQKRYQSTIPHSALPAFTELGFDQIIRLRRDARKGASIFEISKPSVMALFGRPL